MQRKLEQITFIVDKDSVDIKAEDQTKALAQAQSDMEQAAAKNTALLSNAQERAQKLLEDYINNIGDAIGKEYNIKWVYIEDTSVENETEIE